MINLKATKVVVCFFFLPSTIILNTSKIFEGEKNEGSPRVLRTINS